ncbi:hypothetical protein BH09BAC1_BH09BAC1_08530 [soil metagenome]
MKQLSVNWLTEGSIDLEYKKYLLLAYLQHVDEEFKEEKLYPCLSDLINHHHNLVDLKEHKEQALNSFPKKIVRIDPATFELEYERLVQDDEHLEEIQKILEYALPQLGKWLRNGQDIYDYVEEQLMLQPIGIVPMKVDEGYMLLREGSLSKVDVFTYSMTLFESANENYRSLKTQYLASYPLSITNTYQHIKYELIKTRKELPNPATFAIEAEKDFPFKETLYPVAKRLLIKELSRNSIA